jgi:8-oxo-dGTP pyrophosphatase MutT (NUDIX family)
MCEIRCLSQSVSSLRNEIESLHRFRRFRPTVSMVVENRLGETLLIAPAKNPNHWIYPQGGIEPGEDVFEALLRELEEEVGITRESLTGISYLRSLRKSIPSVRDYGWVVGKQYFFFHVRHIGSLRLRVNPNEVVRYVWLRPQSKSFANLLSRERQKIAWEALELAKTG